MGIFKTFSNSQEALPDVYTYDVISIKLRNQIYHIWNDFFKQECFEWIGEFARETIHNEICKAEGVKNLYPLGMWDNSVNYKTHVENHFEELTDYKKILDVILITFTFMERMEIRTLEINPYGHINYNVENAIKDLNYRFKENGVGYEYSNNKIIKIDNKLLHKETIQPTLFLLSEKVYKNANEEFLKAHEHFKHNRNIECLNECLKSFESTIKIICNENGWQFNQTDTAKPLINILIKNTFLPSYNESSLNALKQLLEGTVPTVRNKNSAHGIGIEEVAVPDYLANYMLYITGATIKLLVDTQNERV